MRFNKAAVVIVIVIVIVIDDDDDDDDDDDNLVASKEHYQPKRLGSARKWLISDFASPILGFSPLLSRTPREAHCHP
jgi:hypothetical protein